MSNIGISELTSSGPAQLPALQQRLSYLVIAHGMIVLFIGLAAGVMLIFSLLGAVTLWPLPVWEVTIPGTTRGWQAAHVGGITNGVMMAVIAMIMLKLDLTEKQFNWAGWGMIIMGWGNTLFYWGGNFSTNRALSMSETPFGAGDIPGAIGFLGGGLGMFVTFYVIVILAIAAFKKAKTLAATNLE